MKTPLLLLAVFCLTVSANACSSFLCGGALIVHYVAELELSEPPPEGVCAVYAPHAITTAAEQVNRIDTSAYALANWFIIAAWTEDKEFCGVQFGFSDYDPSFFAYSTYGACFPVTGGLEIPSPGWPGPNEGVAFVVTGDPWSGNYLPIYWFIGYAYGYGSEVIQLVPDRTVAMPFGGTGNCASPPEKWDATLGGLGINMDGTFVEPGVCPCLGACCVGADCFILPEAECEYMGGIFQGHDTTCEPINPCEPIAACCVFGECIEVTEGDCETAGGVSYPGELCSGVTCPVYAVCCLIIEQSCILAFEEECLEAGGVFHPEWDSCEPNPCEPYSPTEQMSWGKIKGLYR